MKKIVAGLLSLMLVMVFFSGCGENKESDFVITSVPPSSYPGHIVKIVVENEQEMESVHLEYPKGTMTPMDRVDIPTWEINFKLPKDKTGNINLGIIGKLKDGSPAITQTFEYEIMENPIISAKVVSESADGVELEVKTSKPFKKVHIQLDDNKQIIFESAGDNTYKVKANELDLENKNYVVSLEDVNGIVLSSDLEYMPENMPYIYRIDLLHPSYKRDSKTEPYDSLPLIQLKPGENKGTLLKILKIYNIPDDKLEKIKNNANAEDSFSTYLLSMSPSRKHLLLNVVRRLFLKDKYINETGKILEYVDASYCVLYDLGLETYKTIGEPHYYNRYKDPNCTTFNEVGPYYFFVRWEKDNLLLFEQRKDPKIMFDKGLIDDDVYDGYSGLVKSKIVSYSLSKSTLTDTDIKPATDWLYFSDQNTGIQGWGLPKQKMRPINFVPKTPDYYGIITPMIISLYGNQKTYNIEDFVPLKVDGYKFNNYSVSNIGFENNTPSIYLSAFYTVYYTDVGAGPSKTLENIYKITPSNDEFVIVFSRYIETNIDDWGKEIVNYSPNIDFFKDYCKYFTIKDGKIISKYKCDKYINPIESFGYIN